MRTTSWSKEQVNLGLAKRAWSHYYIPWSKRDLSTYFQPLFDLCADDVLWVHEGPSVPEVPSFPGVIRGKAALTHVFNVEDVDVVVDNELEDPIAKPLEFVVSGDEVVVLIEERYRVTKTGVTVRNNHTAVVMRFEDGLIVQMNTFGDLSDYIEAILGRGWSTRQ